MCLATRLGYQSYEANEYANQAVNPSPYPHLAFVCIIYLLVASPHGLVVRSTFVVRRGKEPCRPPPCSIGIVSDRWNDILSLSLYAGRLDDESSVPSCMSRTLQPFSDLSCLYSGLELLRTTYGTPSPPQICSHHHAQIWAASIRTVSRTQLACDALSPKAAHSISLLLLPPSVGSLANEPEGTLQFPRFFRSDSAAPLLMVHRTNIITGTISSK